MAERIIDLSYLVCILEKIYFRWAHPEVPDDLWIKYHGFRIGLFLQQKYFRFWKDLCDWVGTKIRNSLEALHQRCALG